MKKLTVRPLGVISDEQLTKMQDELLFWYEKHKRDLPWRHTQNAYFIYLSEIILQQTRVNQGLPYYYSFVEHYPTVTQLADAPLDDVLKLWQGLGYYSRARNMHSTAQFVRDNLQGIFPTAYKQLIELKGIGPYTAAAISSFSSGEVQAVVDGNVQRVLARLYGIDHPIDDSAVIRWMKSAAQDFINPKEPAAHNQAMMELGATICTPKNTGCMLCPLQANCTAFEKGLVDRLPYKAKKTKVTALQLDYHIYVSPNQQVLVQQRDDSGIWEGLFDFPHQSNLSELVPKDLPLSQTAQLVSSSTSYTHLLSHRKITARFHLYKVKEQWKPQKAQRWIELSSFNQLAIPRLIDRFWQEYSSEIEHLH